MRAMVILSASLILSAGIVAGACKQKTVAAAGDDAGTGDDDDTAAPTGNGDQGAAEVPAAPSNGIPCDVEAVLENRCLVCHGTDAPQGPPLLSWDNLNAPSTADPTKTRGQLAAQYMTAKTMPKAPGVATDDEIKTVNDWVAAGMTKSTDSCSTVLSEDAGADDGGLAPILDAGTGTGTCTSNVHWTNGDTGNELMHPGQDCIACHAAKGGPPFLFAGTVYPALHDTNDCNGVDGTKTGTTVKIRPTRGNVRSINLKVNAAGNFFIRADDPSVKDFRPPYRVEVDEPGQRHRSMNVALPGGGCNSCHTETGDAGKPPGRILDPAAGN